MFLSFNELTIDCISSTAIGSTPAKGSSRSTKSGSIQRDLAISTLLLSPPDSVPPLLLLNDVTEKSSKREFNFSSCSSFERSFLISRTSFKLFSTVNLEKMDGS